MKKYLLLSLAIVLSASLYGCATSTDSGTTTTTTAASATTTTASSSVTTTTGVRVWSAVGSGLNAKPAVFLLNGASLYVGGLFTAEGDGIVPRESGHFEGAESEITVAANHTTVHSHPAAVLEVRRILLEHLAELQGRPTDTVASRPVPVWPAQGQVQ